MIVINNVLEWILCEACLRFKLTPWHIFMRIIGMCPGKSYH